jgi:hypothetical protein
MFPGIIKKVSEDSPEDLERFEDILKLQILGSQFQNVRMMALGYHQFTLRKLNFNQSIFEKYEDRMLEIWDEFVDKYKEVSAKPIHYLDFLSMDAVKYYIQNGNDMIDSLHKITEGKKSNGMTENL